MSVKSPLPMHRFMVKKHTLFIILPLSSISRCCFIVLLALQCGFLIVTDFSSTLWWRATPGYPVTASWFFASRGGMSDDLGYHNYLPQLLMVRAIHQDSASGSSSLSSSSSRRTIGAEADDSVSASSAVADHDHQAPDVDEHQHVTRSTATATSSHEPLQQKNHAPGGGRERESYVEADEVDASAAVAVAAKNAGGRNDGSLQPVGTTTTHDSGLHQNDPRTEATTTLENEGKDSSSMENDHSRTTARNDGTSRTPVQHGVATSGEKRSTLPVVVDDSESSSRALIISAPALDAVVTGSSTTTTTTTSTSSSSSSTALVLYKKKSSMLRRQVHPPAPTTLVGKMLLGLVDSLESSFLQMIFGALAPVFGGHAAEPVEPDHVKVNVGGIGGYAGPGPEEIKKYTSYNNLVDAGLPRQLYLCTVTEPDAGTVWANSLSWLSDTVAKGKVENRDANECKVNPTADPDIMKRKRFLAHIFPEKHDSDRKGFVEGQYKLAQISPMCVTLLKSHIVPDGGNAEAKDLEEQQWFRAIKQMRMTINQRQQHKDGIASTRSKISSPQQRTSLDEMEHMCVRSTPAFPPDSNRLLPCLETTCTDGPYLGRLGAVTLRPAATCAVTVVEPFSVKLTTIPYVQGAPDPATSATATTWTVNPGVDIAVQAHQLQLNKVGSDTAEHHFIRFAFLLTSSSQTGLWGRATTKDYELILYAGYSASGFSCDLAIRDLDDKSQTGETSTRALRQAPAELRAALQYPDWCTPYNAQEVLDPEGGIFIRARADTLYNIIRNFVPTATWSDVLVAIAAAFYGPFKSGNDYVETPSMFSSKPQLNCQSLAFFLFNLFPLDGAEGLEVEKQPDALDVDLANTRQPLLQDFPEPFWTRQGMGDSLLTTVGKLVGWGGWLSKSGEEKTPTGGTITRTKPTYCKGGKITGKFRMSLLELEASGIDCKTSASDGDAEPASNDLAPTSNIETDGTTKVTSPDPDLRAARPQHRNEVEEKGRTAATAVQSDTHTALRVSVPGRPSKSSSSSATRPDEHFLDGANRKTAPVVVSEVEFRKREEQDGTPSTIAVPPSGKRTTEPAAPGAEKDHTTAVSTAQMKKLNAGAPVSVPASNIPDNRRGGTSRSTVATTFTTSRTTGSTTVANQHDELTITEKQHDHLRNSEEIEQGLHGQLPRSSSATPPPISPTKLMVVNGDPAQEGDQLHHAVAGPSSPVAGGGTNENIGRDVVATASGGRDSSYKKDINHLAGGGHKEDRDVAPSGLPPEDEFAIPDPMAGKMRKSTTTSQSDLLREEEEEDEVEKNTFRQLNELEPLEQAENEVSGHRRRTNAVGEQTAGTSGVNTATNDGHGDNMKVKTKGPEHVDTESPNSA
ncbi:unnamed protein product [Amoebophrya sp. A120]|nr:unnamed protein product [Amoebophrya sp. A120]|eukprot:GSA120T00009354001.1